MNADSTGHRRLAQLIQLVAREDNHLQAVRLCLLGNDCTVSGDRITIILRDDIGIDRLESFGAKFSRMQYTVVDKLIPTLLRSAAEPVAAAIDNLARMERLNLIDNADEWLQMCSLRNRLVHEYFDRPHELAPALERACHFTTRMHDDLSAMRQYASAHFGIQPHSPGT